MPAVYVSPTRSLAALEMLVHLDAAQLLLDYVTAWIDVPEGGVVEVGDLPDDWRESPSPPELRAIGGRWIAGGRHVALRVPSAVVAGEFNLVLNPRHPDYAALARGAFGPFAFRTRGSSSNCAGGGTLSWSSWRSSSTRRRRAGSTGTSWTPRASRSAGRSGT